MPGRDDAATELHRWLETLIISVGAPLLGLLASRSDPYLIHAAFPWLALVPMLVGAKHGLRPGLISALVLSAGASVHALRLQTLSPQLASWVAGCLLAGAIAGQFRDAARRRRWLLDERANGLVLQLERTRRSRELLEISHGRLAQRMAAPALSLEDSILKAETKFARASTRAELARALLEALSSQAIVQVASFHRVLPGRRLVPEPIAQLGASEAAAEPHALVMRALATGRFASIADAETLALSPVRDHSVVAALPIATTDAQLVAVVAIHRMPFLSLAPGQLRHTLLLAGYLADLMEDRLKSIEPMRPLSLTARRAKRALTPMAAPAPLGRGPANPSELAVIGGRALAADGGGHRAGLALAASFKAPKSRRGPNSL
ncbi:MAG TPA: hypothetical protein VHZ95_02170 [Polyangiales bacterium]|nr:hypothetical protein [Polyangiales bacterium]